MTKPEFRFAERKDTALILQFIKDLAEYEKMADQVVATSAMLEEGIFEKKRAEVLFVMEDGREVGFALFFHNFSTSSFGTTPSWLHASDAKISTRR